MIALLKFLNLVGLEAQAKRPNFAGDGKGGEKSLFDKMKETYYSYP
jgi:hypothetical protein